MPRINCKGIATLIQKDPNAGIKYDKEKKFYAIPRNLADRYVKQSSVPLLLEHNRKFTVGNVDKFYVEETSVDGEKREVLGVEFTIDNESFIDVLRHVCAFRFKEIAPVDYMSSDGFVKTEIGNSNAELDLTAHEAILQRLPGLSLGHDSESLNIVELSLCVAGARPGTVVTQAVYEVETHDSEEPKEEDKEIYREFFAGLHAMSNGFRCRKVEADLKALDMPTTCLVYSKVGEGREENRSITEDETVVNLPNTMEQPQQHHVPCNFSEQMREMLESAFNRYLGTPQKPPITTSNWSTNHLPQGATNYFANDRCRYHKRKRRYVADDFDDDDDTFSDSEDDDRSIQKRGRRMTNNNNKKCRRRVETSTTPQDEILQKQLDDVKEKLKVLVDNIPKKIEENPPPQQPTLTDHLGEMFDKKIKNAISDIQQTMLQQVPVVQQPEPQKPTQPQETQKNTSSQNFSLKADNCTRNKEPTSAKEHFKAKLDDDSFVFGC